LLLPLQLIDPKTGVETPIVVSEDDGIRPDVTAEVLGGLRAVFKKDGTTTAGNSSQVSSSPTGMVQGNML